MSDPIRNVAEATSSDLEAFGSLRASGIAEGQFLGEGVRVVRRMLARGRVRRMLCTPEWAEALPIPPEVEVRLAPADELRRVVGYQFHQCVMALGPIPEPTPLAGGLLVALDHLSSTENVGALVRSAAAFGADGVIVGPGTASPWLRRAVRSAMGTTLDIPIHHVEDLPATLARFHAYAAHTIGERRSYLEVDLASDCCVVFGAEDDGIRPEVLAACRGGAIHIEMDRGVECLNVAASSAVVLAEARRQRLQAGLTRGTGSGSARPSG